MTLINADARQLPVATGTVQCVVTSPPYWGLRDYGVSGQIGLEASPQAFVAEMVSVFREVRRVLRDDGVVWLNLGDSYAGSRRGGDTGASGLEGSRDHQEESKRARVTMSRRRDDLMIPRSDVVVSGLKPKDLLGMPWRVAFALQEDGWWLRSDCVWHKPNPMPEAVKDRPVKCHEYVFLLTKSERYAYYADEVKERASENTHSRGNGVNPKAGKNELCGDRRKVGFNQRWKVKQNASFSAAVSAVLSTRNMRTVWTIPMQPYGGGHFATFPEALAERCILAGSRPGDLVLDPFGGSGTTARSAMSLGRRAVVTELNPVYLGLARERVQVTRGLPLEASS